MNTKNTNIIMQRNIKKRLRMWAIVVAAVLMIPFLAKAPWTVGDFVFAGVVLFSCATVYEFTTRNMSNKMHRIAVGLAVLAFIALVIAWAAAGPDGLK